MGFVDSISWRLLKSDSYAPDQFDLHLLQQTSGELCHLNATISGNQITARSWDEFVPDDGAPVCHFRLRTSEWGCGDKAPEVWIDGIDVSGSVTADLGSAEGSISVEYGHRLGGGPYTTAVVRKSFAVVRTSP